VLLDLVLCELEGIFRTTYTDTIINLLVCKDDGIVWYFPCFGIIMIDIKDL